MRWPVEGRITQGFTPIHKAVDIAKRTWEESLGSLIVAPEKGKVTFIGQMGSGKTDAGLVVQIEADTHLHRLCHLQSASVEVGQSVVEGQVVGKMGYSGYVLPPGKAGTHLHWVMMIDGKRVDGRLYVTNTGGDDVYKGRTAKEWYELAENRGKRLRDAEKIRKKLTAIVKELDKALAVDDKK